MIKKQNKYLETFKKILDEEYKKCKKCKSSKEDFITRIQMRIQDFLHDKLKNFIEEIDNYINKKQIDGFVNVTIGRKEENSYKTEDKTLEYLDIKDFNIKGEQEIYQIQILYRLNSPIDKFNRNIKNYQKKIHNDIIKVLNFFFKKYTLDFDQFIENEKDDIEQIIQNYNQLKNDNNINKKHVENLKNMIKLFIEKNVASIKALNKCIEILTYEKINANKDLNSYIFIYINDELSKSLIDLSDETSCKYAIDWTKELIALFKILNDRNIEPDKKICDKINKEMFRNISEIDIKQYSTELSKNCFEIITKIFNNSDKLKIFQCLSNLQLPEIKNLHENTLYRKVGLSIFWDEPDTLNKSIIDFMEDQFNRSLSYYELENGPELLNNFISIRNELSLLNININRKDDLNLIKIISDKLGFPYHVNMEIRKRSDLYFNCFKNLYETNKNLIHRFKEFNEFLDICKEIEIDTKTNKYIEIASSFFIEEDYNVTKNKKIQFYVDEIKQLFYSKEPVENIEKILNKLIKYLDQENKKDIIVFVQSLEKNNIVNYIKILIRLWEKDTDNNLEKLIVILNNEKPIDKINNNNIFYSLIIDILYFWSNKDKCFQLINTFCIDHFYKSIENDNPKIISDNIEIYLKVLNIAEKIIQSSYKISIVIEFKEIIIKELIRKNDKISLNMIVDIAQKLFNDKNIDKEINCMKLLINENKEQWLETINDICIKDKPKRFVIKFIYKYIQLKIQKNNLTENILKQIFSTTYFFSLNEIHNLINCLLDYNIDLSMIDSLTSLIFSNENSKNKSYLRYKKLRDYKIINDHLEKNYIKICLLVLKSSDKDLNTINKKIEELFYEDVITYKEGFDYKRVEKNLQTIHQLLQPNTSLNV